MASRTGALFSDCAFAFVPSKNLTENAIDLVRQQPCHPALVEVEVRVKVKVNKLADTQVIAERHCTEVWRKYP
jgi:hypothetical protein